jgi:ribosomal protein S18 acetylase RimI-like enzyme
MIRPDSLLVRRLIPEDASLFRPLRLAALQRHPEAFGSSHEEECGQPDAWFARFLGGPPGGAFGGFRGDRLVAIVCNYVQDRPKLRHEGHVASVYVDPTERGQGTGAALMRHLIDAARVDGLSLLRLSVTAGNDAAYRLYRTMGFEETGVNRRGLRIDGVFYDTVQMAMDLD